MRTPSVSVVHIRIAIVPPGIIVIQIPILRIIGIIAPQFRLAPKIPGPIAGLVRGLDKRIGPVVDFDRVSRCGVDFIGDLGRGRYFLFKGRKLGVTSAEHAQQKTDKNGLFHNTSWVILFVATPTFRRFYN